ncbi:interferon-induced protein 44-like [Anarrhichthys ocellatus]|uniref:interferon-induced protein 44-like n=1 Tax=Anarrhichthys ocellatus TaxID=433405 RepID=UPI0012ECEC8F|nr:interferon-induced protein 44-like [Anarrhichthys ocellatus]XP_031696244.1 interferon-induced protein 44-like [Anarrhichthys ocellatus]
MGWWPFSRSSPPPRPLLSEPWRKINSGGKEWVKDYNPQTEGQQLRILLHGLVGAGKSSFINSVRSVLKGRMCINAVVANVSDCCATKKYTTYKFEKESQDTFYPFVLNDMMGLSDTTYRKKRVHVKDIKRALKGHVQNGYTFNADSKLSKDDSYYNPSPSANDKVHILVSVIDANTASQMDDKVLTTIKEIRDEATELGVPQVAILTKIDELCPEIKKDLRNVYKSKKLKETMEKFSKDSGIPMNCIFAVKNYHDETEVNSDTDDLIMSSLMSIINFGNDFLNNKNE